MVPYIYIHLIRGHAKFVKTGASEYIQCLACIESFVIRDVFPGRHAELALPPAVQQKSISSGVKWELSLVRSLLFCFLFVLSQSNILVCFTDMTFPFVVDINDAC